MTTLVHEAQSAAPRWLATLTPREIEVLDLVALGLSNAELAEHLVISLPTVKTHVAQLLRKVGARDRVQLVVSAYLSGYARVPEVTPATPSRPTGRRTPGPRCASRSPRPHWR